MRWQRDRKLTSLEFTEAGVSNVLSNGEVQALFQQILDQGIYSFSASIDDKGIVYPDLARVFPTLTKEEVGSFVEKLRNGGIFETKLLDKVGACPECGSTKSYPKHNCPRCSSFDVGRVLIIEHTRCGYIGSEESFRRRERQSIKESHPPPEDGGREELAVFGSFKQRTPLSAQRSMSLGV